VLGEVGRADLVAEPGGRRAAVATSALELRDVPVEDLAETGIANRVVSRGQA